MSSHYHPTRVLEKFYQYAPNPKKSGTMLLNTIKNFQCRSSGFDWFHVGTLPMPLGELFNILQQNNISPPRTGHMGNWQEIAAGWACSLDHNDTVCRDNAFGYPYIFDFNQTENKEMSSGDTVYLPGSIVNRGKKDILKLFSWTTKNFTLKSRDLSYFVPFMKVKIDNELIPLTLIQRQNCIVYPNTEFNSSFLIKNCILIKKILKSILDHVLKNPDSQLKIHDLVDRVVLLNGEVLRVKPQVCSGQFEIGGLNYKSADHLIEALFIPIHSAHNPLDFFRKIHTMPLQMPLLSLAFLSSLDYIVKSASIENSENSGFNLYFEWGAFGSAAYPPRSRGYYKSQAPTIKKIYKIAIQNLPEIRSTIFSLMPSSIFNILPNSAYPSDILLIKNLIIETIHLINNSNFTSSDLLLKKLENLVHTWFKKVGHELSSYYLGRFLKRRSIHHAIEYRVGGGPVILDEFKQLTVQQACILMGALHGLKTASA